MRSPRFLLAPALLAGCATAGTGTPVDLSRCTATELSRDSLRLEDGAYVYVEATALEKDAHGRVLLAGVPNYVTRIGADGGAVGFSNDSLFGVVLDSGGSVRAVPHPRPGAALNGIRAAPAAGGGWHVLFGEVAPFADDNRPDSATALWYGRFDGRAWQGVERLPLPEEGRVELFLSSSLASRADTLAWTAVYGRRGGGVRVVLYEMRGDRWSHEIVPAGAAYAEPVFLPGREGAAVLVAGAHTRPGESDSNSLLLWVREPGWRLQQRIVHGPTEGRVFDPGAAEGSDGPILSWWSTVPDEASGARDELRALTGGWDRDRHRVVVVDSSIGRPQYGMRPVLLASGVPVWISEHHAARRPPELRFSVVSNGAATLLAATPSPYRIPSFTRGVATGDNELLVTGMHLTPRESRVTSLVIRFRLVCRSR